jgi:hypothetical protein
MKISSNFNISGNDSLQSRADILTIHFLISYLSKVLFLLESSISISYNPFLIRFKVENFE